MPQFCFCPKKRMFFRSSCLNHLTKSIFALFSILVFISLLLLKVKHRLYIFLIKTEIDTLRPKYYPYVSYRLINDEFPVVKEFALSRKTRKYNNEEARVIGFTTRNGVNLAKLNSSTKTIYLATRYFGEWNPRHYYFLHSGNETFARYACPVNNCYVTNNPHDIINADAVLFHLRDLEVYSVPHFRSPDQIWILYSMEPPWLEVKDLRRFDGVFNWTMSYRRNSDVIVRYGFIGKRQKSKVVKFSFKTKHDKAVWYVSNCHTDSNREDYIRRLMKIFPVDIVGGCGVEGCRPAETRRCYIKIAKKYKFYLAFENAICQDYVTEKLFNPLEYHIIPVTLGGADYSKIAPEKSIINAMDFQTPEELGKYLWIVAQNESLYLSYLDWKSRYRSYLQPWMCDLCEKLHGSTLPKTHFNLESWWYGDEPCLRWTKEGLKPVETHPFPIYHIKLF